MFQYNISRKVFQVTELEVYLINYFPMDTAAFTYLWVM